MPAIAATVLVLSSLCLERPAPDAARVRAEAFATGLERSIRAGDANAVFAAFDFAAIADAVCRGVAGSSARLAEFREGLEKGIRTSTRFVAGEWTKQDVLEERAPSRFVIVDYVNQAMGCGPATSPGRRRSSTACRPRSARPTR